MRILRLNLKAFGPFTDTVLDLSGGNFGLHIVYEPNEGGKSTSLRALRQVFYGIPSTSTDDFIHNYREMRIGATIESRAGEVLEFLRRKGNKNTLRAADDRTALDDDLLDRFLAGADQKLFETLFGIDHDTLVRGGEAIVQGSGEIGQILFSAGAGLADLRNVQRNLEEQMNELFKPGAQKPSINKAISEFEAARKRARDAQLASSVWLKHDEALRSAQGRLAEIADELRDAQRQQARLQRIRQALPLIADRTHAICGIEALGPVRTLPANAAEERRDAITRRDTAHKEEVEAATALEDLDRKLEELPLSPSLLGEAEAIEALRDELGSYRKAQRDLPELQGRLAQVERDACAILAELRPDLALERAEELRMPRKQQVAIQNLGSRHDALRQELAAAQNEITEASFELQQVLAELERTEVPRDTTELQQSVRRIEARGDLASQLSAAEQQLREAEARTSLALEKLPLWSGPLEELERRSAPSAETIDRFESEFEDLRRSRAELEKQSRALQSELANVEEQLHALTLEGVVPTEEELLQCRQRRDEGWRLVRRVCEGQVPAEAEITQFIESCPGTSTLTEAYAESVRAADELADRLRREAKRVAQRATLEAARTKCQKQSELQQQEFATLEEQQKRWETDWAAAWQSLGFAPLSPREMRSWLRQQESLTAEAANLRTLRANVADLQQNIASACAELTRILESLGETLGPAESLSSLLIRAETVHTRMSDARERRENLEKESTRLSRSVERAKERDRDAHAKLEEWLNQWAEAVTPMGLSKDALPSQANEVMVQITDMLARLKQARDLGERIDGINREAEQFRSHVANLAERVAPEVATLPAERAAQQLLDLLQKARTAEETRNGLLQQRELHENRLREARSTINAATSRLDALCRDAGCETPDELPEAEQRSAEFLRLNGQRENAERMLRQLGVGGSIEDLIREAADVNPDELPAQIAEINDQIRRLEEEKSNLDQTVGEERALLQTMNGGSEAAEAAEDAQALLARIASEAEEYARLKLAAAVLAAGIERYRQQNQGPILQRGSELFASLTLGSFEKLDVDTNEKGEPVLVGIRSETGKTVPVTGMSDGTADQLYLSLRLALLESYLEKREPLPFIVDDILIQFDDERSAATLRELGRLSQRTQVIFFTHHAHLVEIARQELDAATCFVHRLSQAEVSRRPGRQKGLAFQSPN